MFKNLFVGCCALALILVVGWGGVVAQAPRSPEQTGPLFPQTPPLSPRPPRFISFPDVHSAEPPHRALGLPPLKAVLLVGPIDGDEGEWTRQEKHNMELAAVELETHGVTVFRFYTPDNDWTQIKAAAEGAQFLFYRGHGVYWSPLPSPTVGGFSLKNLFVSSDTLRRDLHLAPNAIVMLYGCFTAGSGNETTLDSAEAQRRVAQYSDPFFDIGAAGYYADWFGDAFQKLARCLFEGKTLGQAYETYYDYNPNTVERYTHPQHPTLSMWLDKDDWDGIKYNYAFAGKANQTLADLFQPPALYLPRMSVTALAEPSSAPQRVAVPVHNTGPGTFTWTASLTPTAVSWLNFHPVSGQNGQTITLIITPTSLAAQTYRTFLNIVASDPAVQDRAQTLPITLQIVPRLYRAYLPVVARSGP